MTTDDKDEIQLNMDSLTGVAQGEDEQEIQYNDGSLSPLVIPYEEAGYLSALAVTDE